MIAKRALLASACWVGLVISCGGAMAFEFNEELSCILFNAGNTDILNVPEGCGLLDPPGWCNCTRTLLTNPRPGKTTGVEQGVIWIRGQPGVGNHRIETAAGTLDVSSLQVGDLIGGTLINELVPEALGVPPATFFKTRGEVRVTAVSADSADFDITIVELSPIVPIILRYNPRDPAHSDGLLYRGRLSAKGPGAGFVLEYRYEGKPDKFPAVQANDADSPGFNVRNAVTFISEESGIYTLPDAPSIEVSSSLRKFSASGNNVANPDEILPLGDDDFCKIVVEPDPCRTFQDLLTLSNPPSNNPPSAVIVVTDPTTLQPLPDPITVFVDCGEGRAIFRGSNSTDGDGGTQPLAYKWELMSGLPEGVSIPQETANFTDTEISFLIPDTYRIRLTVDDGQPENNKATADVEVIAAPGLGPNLPPEVTIASEPSPAWVSLAGASVAVRLNAQAFNGPDGCFQTLSYLWEQASGPAPVTFTRPFEDETQATFMQKGAYGIRVTVDDGAPENNKTSLEIEVRIGEMFQRCDSNGDGTNDLTDPIFSLNYLFLAGPRPACAASLNCDSSTEVDLTDPVYNLNFMFLAGPPPAAPYPSCDFEPDDCAKSTVCTP